MEVSILTSTREKLKKVGGKTWIFIIVIIAIASTFAVVLSIPKTLPSKTVKISQADMDLLSAKTWSATILSWHRFDDAVPSVQLDSRLLPFLDRVAVGSDGVRTPVTQRVATINYWLNIYAEGIRVEKGTILSVKGGSFRQWTYLVNNPYANTVYQMDLFPGDFVVFMVDAGLVAYTVPATVFDMNAALSSGLFNETAIITV